MLQCEHLSVQLSIKHQHFTAVMEIKHLCDVTSVRQVSMLRCSAAPVLQRETLIMRNCQDVTDCRVYIIVPWFSQSDLRGAAARL